MDSKTVLLEISYRIQNVQCKSFRVVNQNKWELMQRVLNENKYSVFSIIVKNTVERLTFSEILQRIKVETDPIKIDTFQNLFGETFYRKVDYFEELLYMLNPLIDRLIDENLSKEKKEKKEKLCKERMDVLMKYHLSYKEGKIIRQYEDSDIDHAFFRVAKYEDMIDYADFILKLYKKTGRIFDMLDSVVNSLDADPFVVFLEELQKSTYVRIDRACNYFTKAEECSVKDIWNLKNVVEMIIIRLDRVKLFVRDPKRKLIMKEVCKESKGLVTNGYMAQVQKLLSS